MRNTSPRSSWRRSCAIVPYISNGVPRIQNEFFLAAKATNEGGDKQGDGFGVFVSASKTEYEYDEWCSGIL